MLRHTINRITILLSNLDAVQGAASVHVSLSREYAIADSKEPTGEAVYTRDQADAQVADAKVITIARQLRDAIAQAYADASGEPVKASALRDAPLTMPVTVIDVGAVAGAVAASDGDRGS